MTSALIARYFVKPGNAALVEATLRSMAARVEADEPACLIYNANVDPDNENRFVLYEVYESEDAVRAHRETPHFQELIEDVVVPVLEKRERELLRRIVG